MIFLSGDLLLISMLLFTETEESGSKGSITGNKSSRNDRARRNIDETPKPKKFMPPSHFPIPAGHQALDSDKSHESPQILESSNQLDPAEVQDLVQKFEINNRRSSKIALSTRRAKSDQSEHTSWRNESLPECKVENKGKRIPKTGGSSKIQRDSSIRSPSSSHDDEYASTIGLNATAEIEPPREKYSHVPYDVKEARRLWELPFSQHSQLIKSKTFQDKRSLDFKTEQKEKEALKLFDWYYPDGAPNPEFHSNHSGTSGSGSQQ